MTTRQRNKAAAEPAVDANLQMRVTETTTTAGGSIADATQDVTTDVTTAHIPPPPPPDGKKTRHSRRGSNSKVVQGGLSMFRNAEAQQPVSRRSRAKRPRTVSRDCYSASSSDESSESSTISNFKLDIDGQQSDLSARVSALQEMVNLLSHGESTFVDEGKIAMYMRKISRVQDKRWDHASMKNVNKMLCALQSELIRQQKLEAAKNVDSVRAVTEHLYVTSIEAPSILAMAEEATNDVLSVAMNQSRSSQGSPILWIVVLKHVISMLAVVVNRLDFMDKGRPQGEKPKEQWQRKQPDIKRRLCRNCLAATPPARSSHGVRDCQNKGAVCNLECTICGVGKHWETQCPSQASSSSSRY